jgi:hypothetical protein
MNIMRCPSDHAKRATNFAAYPFTYTLNDANSMILPTLVGPLSPEEGPAPLQGSIEIQIVKTILLTEEGRREPISLTTATGTFVFDDKEGSSWRVHEPIGTFHGKRG